MDTLYPNLYERFKSEGVCPICLMEMELAPRYACTNGHTICYRCKPYYYACPTCQSPLEMQLPSPHAGPSYSPPPPTHFMPHPLPRKSREHHPSAPPMNDFLNHERNPYSPRPTEDQVLICCKYTDLGCWVKIPEHLIDLHESRCQFRPHLEEELLPTDVAYNHGDMVECRHQVVGCRVRTSPWRISIHEAHCIYKDRFEALNEISDTLGEITITNDDDDRDPEELVECKFRKYGCMVNMPRRRKLIHQEKCNYQQYHTEEEYVSSESECDPDEQVPCTWAEYGCRVRPKRSRLEMHVEKCNYRMEECAFKDNGCCDLIQPSRKFAHERSCQFAN